MNPAKIKAAESGDLLARADLLSRAELGSRTGSVSRRSELRAIRKELYNRKQKPASP
jgi:hypothetical protein